MQTKGIRTLIPLISLALLAGASAQYGRGGGTQGGGGFGGGYGGAAGISGRTPHLTEGDVTTYTHILTPGDRGEWPLTMKDGEVLYARASSTVFDPAIEVLDEKGKKIADNDDIEPGVQDAQVMVRFARAGSYKLLVKGYKSAAGGQYTLSLLRFEPLDATIGARTAGRLNQDGVRWLRFPVQAGQTMVLAGHGASYQPELTLVGPNGEPPTSDANDSGIRRGGRTVFRAKDAGDYYVKVSGGAPGTTFAVTVVAAKAAVTAIGETKSDQVLEPGGLTLWTFAAAKGDLIRVQAEALGAGVDVTVSFIPPKATDGEGTNVTDAFARMPSNPKSWGVEDVLIRREGTYQVAVSQALNLPTTYSLNIGKSAKASPEGQEVTSQLPVGDIAYWTFDAERGQIVRLEGTADQFDLTFSLYNEKGVLLDGNDDGGGNRNPLITALLDQPGRYILCATSYGGGGGGTYRLKRGREAVRHLDIASRQTGSVGGGGADIWSFEGKAGQHVVVSVRSEEFDPSMTIYGPDALEVSNGTQGSEPTDALSAMTLPLDGTYTVWVSGGRGAGKYTIRWLDLDK